MIDIIYREYQPQIKYSYPKEVILEYEDNNKIQAKSLFKLFYVGGGDDGGEEIIYNEGDTLITIVSLEQEQYQDFKIPESVSSQFFVYRFIYNINNNIERLKVLKDKKDIYDNNIIIDIDLNKNIGCVIFYKSIKDSNLCLAKDWDYLNHLSKRMDNFISLYLML